MAIITLLRKPFKGTVAHNTLTHGCGGLNIDGCRVRCTGEIITTHSQSRKSAYEDRKIYSQFKGDMETHQTEGQKLGRWAANLLVVEGATLSRDKISRYFQHFSREEQWAG